MVDIHSHILPGVDDGARTLDQSLAMLDVAARHGTTDIVATPHANSEFRHDDAFLQQRFADLSQAANGSIRLHLGRDFHISYENIQDALRNPARYTINNLNYLMVELPDALTPESLRNVLRRLSDAGMIPVITHPERNAAVQNNLPLLAQCVADGALLQITAQSLLGRFGAEAAHSSSELLRRGLIHFIASDAHDCTDRPPRLDLAHQYIAQRYGEPLADRLCRINPAAALTGQPLESPPAAPSAKWYHFLK